jgi:hypothetical protein
VPACQTHTAFPLDTQRPLVQAPGRVPPVQPCAYSVKAADPVTVGLDALHAAPTDTVGAPSTPEAATEVQAVPIIVGVWAPQQLSVP